MGEKGKDIPMGAAGILVFDKGVIIRAYPVDKNRFQVVLAPDIDAGAIVRDAETGLWSYDEKMKAVLSIRNDPAFSTDIEAGKRLDEYIDLDNSA